MSARRIFLPITLLLILVFQFLPGTPISTVRPVAALTHCDWAQFISDVTVPDGTVFAPGTAFVKTWRLKNIGTCTWTTSYAAVFYSGSQMSAPAVVNLPSSVAPGASVDISVNMVAPTAPGHYVGNWKLRNASSVIFGIGPTYTGLFLVDIQVTATYTTAYDFVANYCSALWTSGAGTLACPGTAGDAKGFVFKADSPQLENGTIDSNPGLVVNPQMVAGGYIKGVFPDFTVQSGDRFQSIINCAYNSPSCYVKYKLNYQIGTGSEVTFWSFNERYEGLYYRANIDLSSLAGKTVKFILYVADVSGYGTPSGDKALWGGAKIVRASSGGPSPTLPPPTTCDIGSFVADVTIPDGTAMTAGTAFTKTWRIRNVGSCTWTTAYSLVFTFGDLLGASSTVIPFPSSVAPGATVDLSVNMVAPATPGHYRSYWRFKNASGTTFGVGSGLVTIFADINVTSSAGTAYDFTAHACEAVWSSGAGLLPCPGTSGDARGYVQTLTNPKLEDGSNSSTGLLTAPQYITDGFIQGLYPAILVHSGDHFQSIINCQYGSTGCYVTFQLNYQIGSGPIYTLKSFKEKIEGMYYTLNVDLSSLAGQNVSFILKVLASGSPVGDLAVWANPRIAGSGGVVPTATVTTNTPTATATTSTLTPTVTTNTLTPTATGATSTPTATATVTTTVVPGEFYIKVPLDLGGLNLRSSPWGSIIAVEYPGTWLKSLESPVISQAKIGTPYEWLLVQDPLLRTGYVAAWLLQGTGSATPGP